MITATDLTFRYPNTAQPVLRKAAFTIQAGTLTLVTGPSGSGKSTLLRCLNGLVPHFTGGEIGGKLRVFNQDPIQLGPEIMSQWISTVFQEPETQFIYDQVDEEIAFALERSGLSRAEMRARVDVACRFLNLAGLQDRKIASLSGGEKQRVAIASALVVQPKVLVLDEPTSQLDPLGADEILRYILSLKSKLGLTVLISEHRLERVLPYADRLISLPGDGSVREGSPDKILTQMEQVPPSVQVAKALALKPILREPKDFPAIKVEPAIQQKSPDTAKSSDRLIAIDVAGLSVQLGEKEILHSLDLSVKQGELLALMGPNGAGKTTLLRSILGLLPSTGNRTLLGEDLKDASLNTIIRQIAYLPQNPNDLLFADTVLDEMKVTLANHDLTLTPEEVANHLDQFGLADLAKEYPRDLSVGERQRVALAAITIYDPPILLLDEPTRGLDYGNKETLVTLLKAWRSDQKTILVVTHDVEFAALLADSVLLIEAGQITYQGSPQDFFTQNTIYQTQTAAIFPQTGWYRPDQIKFKALSL
jgi:energy-coupling factor transport system ATP-binding protein